MGVTYVEFLVEEPSIEVFLRALLPRLLGQVHFEIRTFQCKDDLLNRLPDRMRGYTWFPKEYRIVVVVDRDSDNCQQLKHELERHAAQVGLPTRTHPQGGHFTVVNRIAIEELEAWYFGDWNAVRAAYPRVSATVPRRQRYRNPDAIGAFEAKRWAILARVWTLHGGEWGAQNQPQAPLARPVGHEQRLMARLDGINPNKCTIRRSSAEVLLRKPDCRRNLGGV